MTTRSARRLYPFLKPGTKYIFRVKAIAPNAASPWSDAYEITTTPDQLIEFAAGVTCTALPRFFERDISITWLPVLDLTLKSYRIFRSDTEVNQAQAAEKPRHIPTAETLNPYYLDDTGLLPLYINNQNHKDSSKNIAIETTYWYWVCCVDNADKVGPPLIPDNAEWGVPTKPDQLSATSQVSPLFPTVFADTTLNWRCEDGAEYYEVQIRMGALPYLLATRVEHDTEAGDNQSAIFPGQLLNTDYHFQVRAINIPIVLVSEWSDEKDYTTTHDMNPPLKVTGVDADMFWGNVTVDLKWNPRLDLTEEVVKYRIYRIVSDSPSTPAIPAKGGGDLDEAAGDKLIEVGPLWFHWDDVRQFKDKYIFYWVTAVDKWDGIDGYDGESELHGASTGGMDSVSFTKPAPVSYASMETSYNTIFDFLGIVYVNQATLTWGERLEADWYTVRWQFKPDGSSSYAPWSGDVYVDELWPRQHVALILGKGTIKFGVTAHNQAGSSVEIPREFPIGTDKTKPTTVTGFEGNANTLFDGIIWLATTLSWDSHNWTEGVAHYKITRYSPSQGVIHLPPALPLPFLDRTTFIDILPDGGTADPEVTYLIKAVDVVGNESNGAGIRVERSSKAAIDTGGGSKRKAVRY